jgi:ABC-2 type transport system permease protein
MRLDWRRIGELVRKELRQLVRDQKTRGVIFGAPVVQLLLLGYAVNTDIRNTALFVVDRDGSAASRELVDAFAATEYFHVVGRSERSGDLVQALDHGDAVLGLDIPPEFGGDLAAGRGATVQILLDGSSSNSATVAQGYAVRIVQRFALDRAAARGMRPSAGVELRARAWYNPTLESRIYNVPAVLGIIVLMTCLLLTALSVVRERELGTLDQLVVSPLTTVELMLGKTLPAAAVALVDLVLVSAVAVLWFGVPIRGFPLTLLFAALLFILGGLGIGLFISTISRTQQEAFLTMFLFLQPALILSGFFYPINSMPVLFQWITLVNPVRHFLEIVRAVFLKGEGLAVLWEHFLALALIAVASLRLAVLRFPRSIAA